MEGRRKIYAGFILVVVVVAVVIVAGIVVCADVVFVEAITASVVSVVQVVEEKGDGHGGRNRRFGQERFGKEELDSLSGVFG